MVDSIGCEDNIGSDPQAQKDGGSMHLECLKDCHT